MIQNGLKQAVAEWVEKWVDSTTIHQRLDGVSLSLLLYLFRVVVVLFVINGCGRCRLASQREKKVVPHTSRASAAKILHFFQIFLSRVFRLHKGKI